MALSTTLRRTLAIAPLFLVVACSGVQPADTYTDRTGKTTVFQTDGEMCVKSCNDDYARCMDAETIGSDGVNGPPGMFGTSADCRNNLKTCLPTCKGR